MSSRWICCQIGAREHYAVPRVLHRTGRLAALYTDFWAGPVVRQTAGKTNATALRSLAARFHVELAYAPVVSWNARSLIWEASLRKSGDVYSSFAEIGSQFAIRVRNVLKRQTNLNSDSIFFSYDTGALEAMEWCRERGIQCVLNQMDPSRVETEIVREEEKFWPGWSARPVEVPEAYFNRREKEWALADRILVNSNFCREALMKQGIASEKTDVVPLYYEVEPNAESGEQRLENQKTLRVLFLGQVILRKGIQYLIQAAKLLEEENVRFDVVGPIGISAAALKSAPENMVFHGRVTRDEAANWYRQSDVFVLPTLSDGFAITQLEAMSYGLPVVTTPCCGAVVGDGVDGFIVPPRNADGLAKTFQRYVAEPELLQEQQMAVREKVKQFTLDHLAARLNSLEQALIG
jgi:glycosyltransferase involved in cell wall biosynthesis